MARLSVGLTGGIASGKSTVGRRLAAAGFTVVDADRLVALLHRPGGPGARAVRELFGESYLAPDGSVDKGGLASRVFADPSARERLEAALFPLVRDAFREVARREEGVVVLEATKLVEAGFAPEFDLVVTVEAPEDVRVARAVGRGLSEAEARARIAAQAAESVRRGAADVVVENGGSRSELERQVTALIATLRARATG